MAGFALIDDDAHPAAIAYYSWVQHEPISYASATGAASWMRIPSRNVLYVTPMTLRTLLMVIQSDVAVGSDVLICCHGTSRGLTIPLATGSPQFLSLDNLRILNGSSSPGEIAGQAAKLGLDPGVLKEMLTSLACVRHLVINVLAIRACDVGRNQDLLDALQVLFNSRSISAPKVLDAYVPVLPELVKGQ